MEEPEEDLEGEEIPEELADDLSGAGVQGSPPQHSGAEGGPKEETSPAYDMARSGDSSTHPALEGIIREFVKIVIQNR